MNSKMKEVLGWPALIAAALVGMMTIFNFFGFSLKSPVEVANDNLDEFMVQVTASNEKHLENDMKILAMMDSMSLRMREVSAHMQHLEDNQAAQSRLQDKAIRGECLENTTEMLQIQDLILECRRLGIDR